MCCAGLCEIWDVCGKDARSCGVWCAVGDEVSHVEQAFVSSSLNPTATPKDEEDRSSQVDSKVDYRRSVHQRIRQ